MSDNDPDWDGYRQAFSPRTEDKWKNLEGVSICFEHPATPHMDPKKVPDTGLRQEVDRRLLSGPENGWACLLFIYRERKSTTKPWGPPKFSFQKFRKRGGFWWRYAVVNLPIGAIGTVYEFLGQALDFEDDDATDKAEQDAA